MRCSLLVCPVRWLSATTVVSKFRVCAKHFGPKAPLLAVLYGYGTPTMSEEQLFAILAQQDATTLLALLREAYAAMTMPQRRAVFRAYARAAHQARSAAVDGYMLLGEIQNFMHIPEKTEEWFETLRDFLQESSQLTAQGEHAQAVECFGLLYGLIQAMESGEEIVFADEIGSWMILGDEKQYIEAYLISLAAVATPEAFATVVVPLIERDAGQSGATRAYASALRVANKAQSASLKAAMKRQRILTPRRS